MPGLTLVAWGKISWVPNRNGNQPAGIQPPRNLRWYDKTAAPTGIVFSWDAPLSYGPGPRTPDRYQVDYIHADSAANAAFPGTAPYLQLPEYTDTATREVSDGGGRTDSHVRFRVRAGDSDGNWSDWLTSPALAYEGARPAGRFGGRFSGRFR